MEPACRTRDGCKQMTRRATCTREEAAKLLAALRAEYLMLSPQQRDQIRHSISEMVRVHKTMTTE